MVGDQAELNRALAGLGLAEAPPETRTLALRALTRHGDLGVGLERLVPLMSTPCQKVELDRAAPRFELAPKGLELKEIELGLRSLGPWRKGPFLLRRPGEGELTLDAEWRSDLKWDRVAGLATSFAEKRVFDVGSGNGYFLLRLLGVGAREVTGVEPSLRSILQFLVLRNWSKGACSLLPLRLEELPACFEPYDTVLSMGVLYHQRDPLDHLRRLRQWVGAGGELIVESIVVPGEKNLHLAPDERYAGMRNVHVVPSEGGLFSWLEQAGFAISEVGEKGLTTAREQRRTTFSEGPSLEDVLEPASAGADDVLRRTVEGHPRPVRLLVLCRRRETGA